MKNFDSRVYSINDVMEWHRNDQLILNPRFQRRSVWNDNARSYLMDTILRGKPIPKIFMRQKLNTSTKKSVREVVDGQQRLRTIISYLEDGFQINIRHNSDFGGRYFSQLGDVDADIQANLLNYELAVDLLVNMPDSEILDVFGRLNAYAVVLNEQERLNADHFGPFKTMCDALGHKYYEFWVENKILTEAAALRMGDVTLVADLLIAMLVGISSKNDLKRYYDEYEASFPYENAVTIAKFEDNLKFLVDVMGGQLKTSEFRRKSLFYSLFTALYHTRYGLPGFHAPRPDACERRYARIRNSLERVDTIFKIDDASQLAPEERQFKEDSRRATTNPGSRQRRTAFVLSLIARE